MKVDLGAPHGWKKADGAVRIVVTLSVDLRKKRW